MSDLNSQHDSASTILDAIAEPDDNEPLDGSGEDNVDNGSQREQSTPNAREKAASIAVADDTAPVVKPEPLPAIEPPVSWKAEAKDRFRKLPPEDQRYIADRESERDRGLSEAQQKAAERNTALEAERKAYAERLRQFVDVAKVNPKLAEWQGRDWVKFARENPLEFPAEQLEYQQTVNAINNAQSEAKRVDEQSLSERRQQAHQKLLAADGFKEFWGDGAKRGEFIKEFRGYIKNHDFSEAELDNIDDPRVLVIGRKAMLYDKLMAEQSRIAATKRPPVPGRTLRPQSTTDDADSQAAARIARAHKSGKLDDIAGAILSTL